jgi:hypothetical protein
MLTNGSSLTTSDSDIDFSTISILKEEEWNDKETVTSAIAWNLDGVRFLESIGSQLLIKNNPESARLRVASYYTDQPKENTVYIDTISYKGRHVVISAWKYFNDTGWKLYSNFLTAEWKAQIERAWANLDSVGILNGPSQSYILPNGSIKIKLHPTDAAWVASRPIVSRHWAQIWPTIVKQEKEDANKTHRSFYGWVLKTGSAKKFDEVTN